MSRRSVSRVMLEGGLASYVQNGYELRKAQSCTLSGDSTSHRKINYDARHIALRTPDYRSGDLSVSLTSTPLVRLLGVNSSIDHSSEVSIQGWKDKFTEITELYNESPLSKRVGEPLTIHDILRTIKGMCGDHAANEKATAAGIKAWKIEEETKCLGEEALRQKTVPELVECLGTWTQKMITEAGGLEVWNALAELEQAQHEVALMDEIKVNLGTEVYAALPPSNKREIDLFVWAGCCMHKDQNSFKAGNAALMAWWDKTGNAPPITLANKQNAQLLKKILEPESGDAPLTDIEIAALEASTRGGVKAAALAGAIFNNKDDKKGFGDSHVWHLTTLAGERIKRFPDTNNTRFNSHAEAAIELLVNRLAYLDFLLLIKDKKKSPGWTNIELNVYRALQDAPTLTELAVLALYSQAVTLPYLRTVRGPGTENVNVLDLKNFHIEVRNFIQTIIDNPNLLAASDATPKLGSLDGQAWERPDLFAAINLLRPQMPHLTELVGAFFEGTLPTWVRFTAEFIPGGLIDMCSPEELAQAWMPTTNDTNEGALGAFRVHMRDKPQLTAHQYNAQAMFRRNDTQAFMDATFTLLDHLFIMRKARELDSSGLEPKRRDAQVAFDLSIVQLKRDKDAERKKQEICTLHVALQVKLVQMEQDILILTVKELDQQLDLFQKFSNTAVIPKTKKARGLKDEKQNFLKMAVLAYQEHLSAGGKSVQDSIQDTLSRLEGEDRPELSITQTNWEDEDAMILDELEES